MSEISEEQLRKAALSAFGKLVFIMFLKWTVIIILNRWWRKVIKESDVSG